MIPWPASLPFSPYGTPYRPDPRGLYGRRENPARRAGPAEELTKAIIGTIGALDRPLTHPDAARWL